MSEDIIPDQVVEHRLQQPPAALCLLVPPRRILCVYVCKGKRMVCVCVCVCVSCVRERSRVRV